MLRSTSLLRKLSRPLAQAGTSVRSYQYKAPVKEMLFCSEEVHGYQEHYKTLNNLSGADASPEMVKEILEGMGKFCEVRSRLGRREVRWGGELGGVWRVEEGGRRARLMPYFILLQNPPRSRPTPPDPSPTVSDPRKTTLPLRLSCSP
jgi:hypothetical protein